MINADNFFKITIAMSVLVAVAITSFLFVQYLLGDSANEEADPVIYTQETTVGDTKCIVASLDTSIAITCNWKK